MIDLVAHDRIILTYGVAMGVCLSTLLYGLLNAVGELRRLRNKSPKVTIDAEYTIVKDGDK